MIDPFHLDAYGITTVNYNRDVEIFPVLRAIGTEPGYRHARPELNDMQVRAGR